MILPALMVAGFAAARGPPGDVARPWASLTLYTLFALAAVASLALLWWRRFLPVR